MRGGPKHERRAGARLAPFLPLWPHLVSTLSTPTTRLNGYVLGVLLDACSDAIIVSREALESTGLLALMTKSAAC